MNRSQIREILLAHGFTIKPGHNDLKEYVYQAAEALIAAEREACVEVCENMKPSRRAFDPSFYTACELNAETIRQRGQQ